VSSQPSDPKLPKVPVNQLKGRQLSSEFSGSNIKRLKKSLQVHGYNNDFPIEVAEIDGRMIIIDGHHRARAAGSAGIPEVPVRIVPVTLEQANMLLEQAAEAAENLGLSF
jgi:ParB-like chromosome segregation protein Spo0J